MAVIPRHPPFPYFITEVLDVIVGSDQVSTSVLAWTTWQWLLWQWSTNSIFSRSCATTVSGYQISFSCPKREPGTNIYSP